MDSSTIHRPLGDFIRGKNSLLIICKKNEKMMTPVIFRHRKCIPDGNINIISNGGGLIPIIETGSYGRPQGHINCLRVLFFHLPLPPARELSPAQSSPNSRAPPTPAAQTAGLPSPSTTMSFPPLPLPPAARKRTNFSNSHRQIA